MNRSDDHGAGYLQELRGRRALVLGATGFIGSRVVRALVAARCEVVVAGRDATILARLGHAYSACTEVCDLASDNEPGRLIRRVMPDVTFNLAGYGVRRSERDADVAERINATVPGRLAEEIAALGQNSWHGQRLVHTGSALEYGDVGGDLSESQQAQPTTLYGRTKLNGTLALAQESARGRLRAITVRLFTVYGPGEAAERLLPTLMSARDTGAVVELTSGAQRRDFVFVDDVAEGLLRLAVSPAAPGEVVNLASGTLLSVREFVQRAADVIGLDSERLLFGGLPTRPDEIEHDPVTNARLRELTGWIPAVGVEEGVRLTMADMNRLRVAGDLNTGETTWKS